MGVGKKAEQRCGRKRREKMKIGKHRNGDEENKQKNKREEKTERERRDEIECNQKCLS
jgi:hypothetical protein